MTQEHHPLPDRSEQQRQRDLAWVRENQSLFWLVAGTAYEEIGRGVIMVDLIHNPPGQGHPFSYYAEGELDLQDRDLQHYLREYAPDREFIIVLQKTGERTSVYCVGRPPNGWMTDMETQIRYEEAGSDL